MNDQIADLLVRIRNAAAAGKSELEMPSSKMKEVILDILKKEGFVGDVKVTVSGVHKSLKITLVSEKLPVHIRQISRPGQRIYVKNKDIPRPLRGLGLVVISTPHGVISGREAKRLGVGGEVICEVW